MGRRYTKFYMQTALDGSPNPWLVPPPRIFAADLGDTLVSGILSGVGAYLLSGGISYLTTNRIDMATCISWSAITAGGIIVLPLAGDALSEIVCDISQAVAEGWYRGQPEPDEPKPEPVPPEPIEDEAGAARVPGAWWYRTKGGQLRCYYTPINSKDRKPIISDQRMQAIFRLALQGTAFSEDAIRAQIKGLSQPRFRILQRDWRKKVLYKLNDDNSGYLTTDGKIVAEAIVNTPLPQSH